MNTLSTPLLTIQPAEHLSGVVDQLDHIINWSATYPNRLGYFPSLYRKMTKTVQARISQGLFDDEERMERMVTLFANRYFEALHAFLHQQECSDCWQIAFKACSSEHPLVLQHLLLGMNAHINLDLGIAAALVVEPEDLPAFEADFNRINDILAFLLEDVSAQLSTIWRPFAWFDRLGGRRDEQIINFSLSKARLFAWKAAQRLNSMRVDKRPAAIQKTDQRVALIGQLILRPGWKLRLLIRLMRRYEKGSVSDIIHLLK